MADKQKRFRLLVVKEIYDTERDYTENLEFTVTVRSGVDMVQAGRGSFI